MTDSNSALDTRQSQAEILHGKCLRRRLFYLHIALERVDPARNIARYYVLSIEPTLFAKHTLIRRWGRIG
jgi:hypothetical protein